MPVTEEIGGKGKVQYINADQVDHLDDCKISIGVWKKDYGSEKGYGKLAGYLNCSTNDIKKIDLNA